MPSRSQVLGHSASGFGLPVARNPEGLPLSRFAYGQSSKFIRLLAWGAYEREAAYVPHIQNGESRPQQLRITHDIIARGPPRGCRLLYLDISRCKLDPLHSTRPICGIDRFSSWADSLYGSFDLPFLIRLRVIAQLTTEGDGTGILGMRKLAMRALPTAWDFIESGPV